MRFSVHADFKKNILKKKKNLIPHAWKGAKTTQVFTMGVINEHRKFRYDYFSIDSGPKPINYYTAFIYYAHVDFIQGIFFVV